MLFYYKISIFYKFHHLIKLILSIYYILSNTIDDIYFIVPQSLLYLYQISSILYIYNFKQYEPIVIPIICDIGMPNNIIVIPYTKSYIIFNQFWLVNEFYIIIKAIVLHINNIINTINANTKYFDI